MNPWSQPWSRLWPALAELALVFAGMLVGVGVLFVAGALGLAGSEGGPDRLYGYVWGPGITAVAAIFYRWLSRAMESDDQRVDPAMWRKALSMSVAKVLGYVAGGIVAALAGSYVLGELAGLVGFPVEEQAAILEIVASAKDRGAWLELAVLGAAAVVFAPAAEEWLFRGLLFRKLLRVSGKPEAYILSAVAFAAIHTNPAGFIIYAWLGVCFAYTLHKTDKLWAAILVHAGNNAFAYALLVSG